MKIKRIYKCGDYKVIEYANGYFDTGNGFVSVDKVIEKYEKELYESREKQ